LQSVMEGNGLDHGNGVEAYNHNNGGGGGMEQRFVGSLGGADLRMAYREECARDHSVLALETLSHTVQLLTEEWRQRQPPLKKTEPNDGGTDDGNGNGSTITTTITTTTTTALVARLNFLMGGILKNEGRYVEAIAKLQSASQASKLFPSVQHAIETALVECWKGCEPSAPGVSGGGGDDDERRRRRRKEVVESSVRMVFNPRIHPLMTVEEMDGVLWGAFSVEGGGGGDGGGCDGGDSGDSVTVRWPHGSEHTQPFYFALTFPLQTYAIEGIEVRSR